MHKTYHEYIRNVGTDNTYVYVCYVLGHLSVQLSEFNKKT